MSTEQLSISIDELNKRIERIERLLISFVERSRKAHIEMITADEDFLGIAHDRSTLAKRREKSK